MKIKRSTDPPMPPSEGPGPNILVPNAGLSGPSAGLDEEVKRRRIETLQLELESLVGSTRVGTGLSTPSASMHPARHRKIPALPEIQSRTLHNIKQHLYRCRAILADHRIDDCESISVKSAVVETLKHCADAHCLGMSLIDETWAILESSLVRAFGDPAKLRQEYDRAAGALNFSYQNPMQFMVGARNLSRLHMDLNYSQPDFLRLLMGKCPKLLLTVAVTGLRSKREDWMMLPIEEIFDALNTAINTEAEVSAMSLRPRSLAGAAYGVFRPTPAGVNSIEEDPHQNQQAIHSFPYSRYVAVRDPDFVGPMAKDAAATVLRKNQKGKWFMLVGFNDKAPFEEFIQNLDSAGVPHRPFEDRRKTGSKNMQEGH